MLAKCLKLNKTENISKEKKSLKKKNERASEYEKRCGNMYTKNKTFVKHDNAIDE